MLACVIEVEADCNPVGASVCSATQNPAGNQKILGSFPIHADRTYVALPLSSVYSPKNNLPENDVSGFVHLQIVRTEV